MSTKQEVMSTAIWWLSVLYAFPAMVLIYLFGGFVYYSAIPAEDMVLYEGVWPAGTRDGPDPGYMPSFFVGQPSQHYSRSEYKIDLEWVEWREELKCDKGNGFTYISKRANPERLEARKKSPMLTNGPWPFTPAFYPEVADGEKVMCCARSTITFSPWLWVKRKVVWNDQCVPYQNTFWYVGKVNVSGE